MRDSEPARENRFVRGFLAGVFLTNCVRTAMEKVCPSQPDIELQQYAKAMEEKLKKLDEEMKFKNYKTLPLPTI